MNSLCYLFCDVPNRNELTGYSYGQGPQREKSRSHDRIYQQDLCLQGKSLIGAGGGESIILEETGIRNSIQMTFSQHHQLLFVLSFHSGENKATIDCGVGVLYCLKIMATGERTTKVPRSPNQIQKDQSYTSIHSHSEPSSPLKCSQRDNRDYLLHLHFPSKTIQIKQTLTQQ